MSNLKSVSEEVFRILRSYNYEVVMYDDDGNSVFEPEDGRRFYAKKANILVSVRDENENSSINLNLSKSTPIGKVMGLITALRMCATKYNMMFHDSRNFKAEIEPKHFASKFSVSEAKDSMNDISEGQGLRRAAAAAKKSRGEKLTAKEEKDLNAETLSSKMAKAKNPVSEDLNEAMYGTSRSSYLKLENAKMIVRHSTRINEESVGARTRNVAKIFVENEEGERYLMPTRQLGAARAMTQHFNHGGGFADDVGSQINRMTQSFADLGGCQSFVVSNAPALSESAKQLGDKCASSRKAIKETFSRLFRESTYAEEANALREAAASPVLVEAAQIEHLREMLAIEGKKCLEDSILESVARYCDQKDDVLSEDDEIMNNDEDTGPKKRETWDNIPQVKVLGKLLSASSWNDFLAHKLDLRPESVPEKGNPRFTDRRAEMAYKLQIIAKNCMDSTMSSFLSYVADMIADPLSKGANLSISGTDPVPTPRQLEMVAKQALACAGMTLTEGLGLGFGGIKAIREFEEWFNTMIPSRVLSESFPDDFRGQLPGEDGGEEDLEHEMSVIAGDFNVDDFLLQYPMTGDTSEQVKAELDSYLRGKIYDRSLENADISSWVDELYPQVAQALGIVDESDMNLLPVGEEILDEFQDESFDDDAAREHIADMVRDGEYSGISHDVSWELKVSDENRGDTTTTAYIAKLIRQGQSGGEHPHWQLVLTPMAYDGLMEDANEDEDDSFNSGLDEGNELTREDVLLPSDQGQSLKGEVLTKPNPNNATAMSSAGLNSPVGSAGYIAPSNTAPNMRSSMNSVQQPQATNTSNTAMPMNTNPSTDSLAPVQPSGPVGDADAQDGTDDQGNENDKMIAELKRLSGLH
jgi:hypothetical protein